MERNLAAFTKGDYRLGRSKVVLGIWYLIAQPVIKSRYTPSLVRVNLLRLFGSKIEEHVFIRSEVQIYFPWNLTVGSNSWIGSGATFINHAPIHIEKNVCISQNVTICSGSHDFKSVGLEYNHREIRVKQGAWVCLGAILLPGSSIGQNSVISAGEVVQGFIPDSSLVKNQAIVKLEY
jgi:putative colanic acid biosynthesis acetyltransferase WcaF